MKAPATATVEPSAGGAKFSYDLNLSRTRIQYSFVTKMDGALAPAISNGTEIMKVWMKKISPDGKTWSADGTIKTGGRSIPSRAGLDWVKQAGAPAIARLAVRYERLARNFLGMIRLRAAACAAVRRKGSHPGFRRSTTGIQAHEETPLQPGAGTVYSYRNAIIGSTAAARRAGR